ncbi:MAG: DUF559 domain-containing protein [Phycisphaerae bacterium]|nr:DUF559 domain-containing protein [Phycisphaerae bacterium]
MEDRLDTHHGGFDRVEPGPLSNARQLRAEQTPPELLLWNCLRSRKLGGLKFRRQHPLGPFILDFYCNEALLGVELDGKSHEGKVGADASRIAWFESHGIKVLRFRNKDLAHGLARVLEDIQKEGASRVASGHPHPPPASRGHPLPEGEG